MNGHDFDQEVEDYRTKQDGHVRMSGESGAFFAEYKVQKLVEWFPEYRDSPVRVLDFGCGDGLMTSFVPQYMARASVAGIDVSQKSIEYARARYSGVTFDWFDGSRSDLPDQSVDLIYAAGVFHHVPPRLHGEVYAEIIRLLKPGGRFVLFELDPFNPLTVLAFTMSEVDKGCKLVFPQGARRLLRPFGEIRTIYYFFFPAALKRLRPLERYMTWLPIGALSAVVLNRSEER